MCGVTTRIVRAWALTIPGAALIAAGSYALLNWLHD
jgi:phosphate/sulfate permease